MGSGTEFEKHIYSTSGPDKGLKIGTVWVTHRHPRHYQAVATDGAALHGGKGWVTHTGYLTVADAEASIRRYHKNKIV